MSLDFVRFATFDTHGLARPGATEDYPDIVVNSAAELAGKFDAAGKAELTDAVVAGLAGAVESSTLQTLRRQLDRSADIGDIKRLWRQTKGRVPRRPQCLD